MGRSVRVDAALSWHNFIRDSDLPLSRNTAETLHLLSMVIRLSRAQDVPGVPRRGVRTRVNELEMSHAQRQ